MAGLLILADGKNKNARNTNRGKLFEKLAADVFRHWGYEVSRFTRVNYAGMEIDIEGIHKATGIRLYAECKCYSFPVDSPKFQEFFGKYMTFWLDDNRVHGIFVALPRLTSHAKGFYNVHCRDRSDVTIKLYEEDGVFEGICTSHNLTDPSGPKSLVEDREGKAGENKLLCTPDGFSWIQYVIPPGSMQANSIIIFDGKGERISDKASLSRIMQLCEALEGLTILNATESSLPLTRKGELKAEQPVDIQKSSSYARPVHTDRPVTSLDELLIRYALLVPAKRPCFGATVDDLNWDLVEKFAESLNPGLTADISKEEVLEELRLFLIIPHYEERFLHQSAVLCFSRRPSKFYPQARAVFASSKSSDGGFVTKDIQGPLSEQVRQLVTEVMAHLDKISFISADGRRRERDEIDRDVIRELVSNAVIHRDYEMSGTVVVRLTPEAVDVENPGGFPGRTSWDMLIRRKHTSNPIDPTISLYMRYLEFMEGIGRGFEVFKKYIKENGPDSITYEALPGPAVRIRVRRLTSEDVRMRAPLEELKSYLIVSIGSLSILVVFALTLAGAHMLTNIWPEVGMIVKIVAWPLTILGAICSIAAVFNSSYKFLRFMLNKKEEAKNE